MKTIVPPIDLVLEFDPGSIKAAVSEHNATGREMFMVPIGDITAKADFNVRIQDDDYEAHVEEIKQSIMENGFFTRFPLSCYVNKEGDQNFFQVVGGFTRFDAAKRAVAAGMKLEKLPVVVVPNGTSMLDLWIGLDRDNTSNRLKPYERAIVVKRAVTAGATEDEVATKLGISKQYVGNLLYMMGLPKAVHTLVIQNKVSLNTAVETAKKEGAGKAAGVLSAAINAAPAAGTPAANNSSRRAPPPRATGRNIARVVFSPNKRLLDGAIHYAIALPTAEDGITWLSQLISGNDDAVKELKAALRKAGKGGTPVPADPKVTAAERKAAKDAEKQAAKDKKKAAADAAKAAAKKGKGKKKNGADTDPLGANKTDDGDPLGANQETAPPTGEPADDVL